MNPLEGDSTTQSVPGVKGTNSVDGNGVFGDSALTDAVVGFAHAAGKAGVLGLSPIGNAVAGISDNGTGVFGQGLGFGVFATTTTGVGVNAHSDSNNAVHGDSGQSDAVVGLASAAGKAGILGLSPNGNAVAGISDNGTGVFGQGLGFGVFATTTTGVGVNAHSDSNNAVHGDSGQSDAVVGLASAAGKAGILGLSPNGNAVVGISTNGTGVFGQGGQLAGSFVGKVLIQGDLQLSGDVLLTGADCAEDFDMAGPDTIEPGTVMALDGEGRLEPSQEAYERKVVGVISGAGNYKASIVLDKRSSSSNRVSIALMGKVYAKVDARYGSINVGDLLTSSPTAGHAMKVDNPTKAFGSVIGKALQPQREGRGMIPILIALQ